MAVNGELKELQLSRLQRERHLWVDKNFPNDREEDSIFGAVEELGELAHHFLKRRQGIRSDGVDHRAEILDAVADCVIFLAGVCDHEDADFGIIVEETWARVKARDWVGDPSRGGE